MPYKFSKDYDTLFDRITAGEIIAAFVDYYDKDIREDPWRDICKVQRWKPYLITIGVRGIGYGGLMEFDEEDGEEKTLFVRLCKALNLEWIE